MIHEKLLAFQKLNITIKRDAINPHFRSSYTSLNEVLDKVKKPLNDAGIVIEQRPCIDDSNESGLSTVLRDTEDDSFVEAFIPFIGATDMQKLGGAITYARRYSLVALLGLEDEDDDGNRASAPTTPRAAQRPAAPSQGPAERNDEPFPDTAPATAAADDEIPDINID